MNDLRVLYLQGNPVVKLIRHYRKTLVSRCPNLKYLDDRYARQWEVCHKCFAFTEQAYTSTIHYSSVLLMMSLQRTATHFVRGHILEKRTKTFANLHKRCFHRPVFEEERRRCVAWSSGMAEGGLPCAQEAERGEMAKIREEKRANEERQYLTFEEASSK